MSSYGIIVTVEAICKKNKSKERKQKRNLEINFILYKFNLENQEKTTCCQKTVAYF